jgi:hypothetical protein
MSKKEEIVDQSKNESDINFKQALQLIPTIL